MRTVISLCLLFCATLSAQNLRTFTSTDGQTIEASVVNYDPNNGKVVIRRVDNHKFTVPYDRFSKEDQAYLDDWREEYDRSFAKLNFMGIQVRTSRVAFVIDKSGSMSGDQWEKLVYTLEPIINGLYEPSDFNIIAFGSSPEPFRKTMVEATSTSKLEAINWLNGVDPSGGTNVISALETAFNDPELETIILLTDGYPNSAPESIYAQVDEWQRKRKKSVVIHAVSYQSTRGKDFLRELAKRNGGRFTTR